MGRAWIANETAQSWAELENFYLQVRFCKWIPKGFEQSMNGINRVLHFIPDIVPVLAYLILILTPTRKTDVFSFQQILLQFIIASDGNVSFVILLCNNVDHFNKPVRFFFNKEGKHQDFRLGSGLRHIFRIDG